MPSALDPKNVAKYINQDDLEQAATKIVELIKSEQNNFNDENSRRIILGGYG